MNHEGSVDRLLRIGVKGVIHEPQHPRRRRRPQAMTPFAVLTYGAILALIVFRTERNARHLR